MQASLCVSTFFTLKYFSTVSCLSVSNNYSLLWKTLKQSAKLWNVKIQKQSFKTFLYWLQMGTCLHSSLGGNLSVPSWICRLLLCVSTFFTLKYFSTVSCLSVSNNYSMLWKTLKQSGKLWNVKIQKQSFKTFWYWLQMGTCLHSSLGGNLSVPSWICWLLLCVSTFSLWNIFQQSHVCLSQTIISCFERH